MVRQTQRRIPCTRSGGRQRCDASPLPDACAFSRQGPSLVTLEISLVRSRAEKATFTANFQPTWPSGWARLGGEHVHHRQCGGGACGAGRAFGGSTGIGCVTACRHPCPIVDKKRYSAMTLLARACTHHNRLCEPSCGSRSLGHDPLAGSVQCLDPRSGMRLG